MYQLQDFVVAGGLISYRLPSFEAAARSLKVAAIAAPVHNDAEIESVYYLAWKTPGGGLVVNLDVFMFSHRATTILLAARNTVPTVSHEGYARA